jgi:hypothetical protein
LARRAKHTPNFASISDFLAKKSQR